MSRVQKVLLHSAVVNDKWFVVSKNNGLTQDHVGLVSARGTFCTDLLNADQCSFMRKKHAFFPLRVFAFLLFLVRG
jgi:hypothetical protein